MIFMTAFSILKILTEIFDNTLAKTFKHLFNTKAGIFIVIQTLVIINLMDLENVNRVTELRNHFFTT
jgi:hypothetical protein